MQIKELFVKPIDRVIHKVVDVGNADSDIIQTEIEEYVITNEVNQHLHKLLEVYTSGQRVNSIGVWIAGYFGSGKSHLLKMLSFLLTNRTFTTSTQQTRSTVDIFAEKVWNDALLSGQIKRIADIPSESILFNIDQQAPQGSGQSDDVVLAVFLKMFNNHCGYYGNTPFIANFERDLDERNMFEAFKTHFAAISQTSWEQGRELYALYQDHIDQAFSMATSTSIENARGTIQRYENTYTMSIDIFGEMVKRYIERRGPKFRLNFFVDEVGQFVANRTPLMLNLQSISEVLSEKAPARAWVFITSQQDLSSLVKDFQGQDLSKIQARYGNLINLTSTGVDEVIQKRLLTKREHVVGTLQAIHQRENNNYATLFNFGDSSEIYNTPYRGEQEFVDYYPFVPYQFKLFQQALVALSNQEAFVGSYQAVGERSLIAAAQEAVVQKMHLATGRLVAFDDMYSAIDASVKSIFKNSISFLTTEADQTRIPPMAIRVLKALFLVKYIKNFTATTHNLRVLLFDTFQSDMRAFDNSIYEALMYLEQYAYVQRDGKSFSYLTDEEKEIEKSIRSIQIDVNNITEEIDKLVFTRALNLGTGKTRINEYDQDYQFTRMIDHAIRGNQHELGVRIITPYHDTQDEMMLATQTAGKAELVVKLTDHGKFMDELRLYIQTQRYIAQVSSQNAADATRSILQARANQNQRRYDQLNQDIKVALQNATYICNASTLQVGTGDYMSRFNQAFLQMVNLIYSNRRLVQTNYTRQMVHAIATGTGQFDLGQDAIAREVQGHINMMRGQFQGITLKSLLDKYQRRPYGWPLYAVLAAVAMLAHSDQIEVRQNGNVISKRELTSVIENHAMAATVMIEAQSIPQELIQPLVTFYQEYSAQILPSTGPSQVVDAVKQAFVSDINAIDQLLNSVANYPFVANLQPFVEHLKRIQSNGTNWFFQDFGTSERDDLVYQKHQLLNPVLQFFNSIQKQNFDEAIKLVSDVDNNVRSAAPEEHQQLAQLVAHPEAFRGAQMTKINQQVARIRERVNQHIEQVRAKVHAEIDTLYRTQIVPEMEKATLTPDQANVITQALQQVYDSVQSQMSIWMLQQMPNQFRTGRLITILNEIHHMARPVLPPDETGEVTPPPPAIVFVHASSITVPHNGNIETSADLEAYLQTIRQAYQAVLDQGKKITL